MEIVIKNKDLLGPLSTVAGVAADKMDHAYSGLSVFSNQEQSYVDGRLGYGGRDYQSSDARERKSRYGGDCAGPQVLKYLSFL